MIFKKIISVSLIFALLFSGLSTDAFAAVSKADERIEVRSSETEQLRVLLANQKVTAVMTDGTRVNGKVKEVRSGTIVINVASSDGSSPLPKGDQSVATERFNTIEVTSYKGKKRGILAAALGGAGFLLGVLATAAEIESLGGESAPNGAGVAVLVAATAGGATAGYLLGRNLDKKRVTVVILR